MRVLFFHDNQPDYLAESLFHGLRSLLGSDCVDVPRYDSMYAPMTEKLRSKLRGYGFTLYGLLGDIQTLVEKRFYWRYDLDSYDLIVIGNIWTQWQLYWELIQKVDSAKMAILDGSDTPAFFPNASRGWRLRHIPWSYLTPVSRCKYFKREFVSTASAYGLNNLLPTFLHSLIQLRRNALPIGFSIPKEKIKRVKPGDKSKRFPLHIVDEEIATRVNGSFCTEIGSGKYAFSSEESYYNDLRSSFYGITMKRAGWDCMRHYELAANGCVMCFRDLDLKPSTCAPHGLDESNCIAYHNYDELEQKITSITDDDYSKLQEKSYGWIMQNTTIARAHEFLAACS
jgi:hypothetical protein